MIRTQRNLSWLMAAASLLAQGLTTDAEAVENPYEAQRSATRMNRIDKLVQAQLESAGITGALPCSDDVFIRRAFIDVTGTLPPQETYWKYKRAKPAIRRTALIDGLLETEAYVGYWALKWSDLLRIKAEFPINLWPNGVQAYYRWIRESVADNKPYDQFARELLTSSGSNFRVPPVNFYRAIEGQEPETIAAAVSLNLMGVRWDSWSEQQQADMAHIFSRVAYKGTAEWKEEIVMLDPEHYSPMDLVFPDGSRRRIKAGEDPRVAFADWLIQPGNPWFAKSMVNRIWFWLMGRGLIHEPDDIRDDNPCVNPELMSYLEREFIKSGYDIKSMFRLILSSQTYQQSAIPQSDHPESAKLFAHYIVRRLDAEVLFDAFRVLGGQGELYQSPVPEPFTFFPEYKRTVDLSDGSITSQFLEKFGRPGRDTGMELERDNSFSVDQSMYLLNSSEVQTRIQNSFRLRQIVRGARRDNRKAIEAVYRMVLTRPPTSEEVAIAQSYPGISKGQMNAYQDLTWALINSKEFLYRH